MITTALRGTIVPLITPFSAEERFNQGTMNRLIEYVLDQGADGLMPTALTGEGPLLTEDETLAVWDVVFEKTAGQRPIVPAIISTTTKRAIHLARAAEKSGAVAVMIAPIIPELYAGRSQEDVYGFYSDIAAETSLPIILFNYPSLTSVDFTPSLVENLARIDNIRYIKESTGDCRRVHSIQRLLGDRIEVICGAPNVALESLALGCRVWITGTMNAMPRSAKQLMRAVHDVKDLDLARRIYYRHILSFVDIMSRNNNPTGTIKAGVAARGVDVGSPRRPGSPVSPADQARIAKLIKEIALMEEAESANFQ
ncbi:MAG: dihydrodipicolinate synthase family protein [Deltaproteobacteria bacterium]|nr:dihydrodipicolinate synthase family protein [Deltaproteobacteria bacterium]